MSDTPEAVERLSIIAKCDTDSAMRHFAYAAVSPDPKGDYVYWVDYAALLVRLQAAEAEVDSWKSRALQQNKTANEQEVRAEQAEAALTEARAETAAVIEAAIYEVNAMADFSCGCDPVHCRCYRDREAYHLAAEHLSDTLKAPAHAKAALDEIKRQAREDALREAAALCQGLAEQHADAALTGLPHNARIREGMEAAFTNARYAILALIDNPKEKP